MIVLLVVVCFVGLDDFGSFVEVIRFGLCFWVGFGYLDVMLMFTWVLRFVYRLDICVIVLSFVVCVWVVCLLYLEG